MEFVLFTKFLSNDDHREVDRHVTGAHRRGVGLAVVQ